MLAPPDVLALAGLFLHGVGAFMRLEVFVFFMLHWLLMWSIALNHVPLDLQLLGVNDAFHAVEGVCDLVGIGLRKLLDDFLCLMVKLPRCNL